MSPLIIVRHEKNVRVYLRRVHSVEMNQFSPASLRLVGKLAGVIEDQLLEDEAIGSCHNAAVVAVGVDPLPGLHRDRSQCADIDHVPFAVPQFGSLAQPIVVTGNQDLVGGTAACFLTWQT